LHVETSSDNRARAVVRILAGVTHNGNGSSWAGEASDRLEIKYDINSCALTDRGGVSAWEVDEGSGACLTGPAGSLPEYGSGQTTALILARYSKSILDLRDGACRASS